MDSQYLTLKEISLKYNIPYILCSNYIKQFELEYKENKINIESEAFNFFLMTVSQKKPLILNDLKSGLIQYIIVFLQENDHVFSKINFFSFNEADILLDIGYQKSKESFKIIKLNLMIKTLKLTEKLKTEKYNSTHFPSKIDSEFLYFIFPYLDTARINKLLKNTDNNDINSLLIQIKDDILKKINMIEYELDIQYIKKKAV